MCRVTFDILYVKEQQEKNIVVFVDDAPAVDVVVVVVDDAPVVDVVDVDMCSTFSR